MERKPAFLGVLPFPTRTSPQNYNNGGAPLPYATDCSNTAAAGTCDPGVLMEYLSDPGSAQAVDLDLPQDVEADDAVGEVSNTQHACRHLTQLFVVLAAVVAVGLDDVVVLGIP